MKLNRRQLRRLIENTLREQSEVVDVSTATSKGGVIRDQTTLQPGEEKRFRVRIQYSSAYEDEYSVPKSAGFGAFDDYLHAVGTTDQLIVTDDKGQTYAPAGPEGRGLSTTPSGNLTGGGATTSARDIYYQPFKENIGAGTGANIVIVSVRNNDSKPATVGFVTSMEGP